MMKDAYKLLKHQWFTSWIALMFSFAFFGLYGAVSGFFTNEWLREYNTGAMVFPDITILCFMSSIGFFFSKAYLNPYWRTDTFTKNLATLRALPISTKTLAASRILQILIMAPLNAGVFFTAFYVCSSWAREFHFITFVSFVLVWLFFGIICSAFLILLEWGTSGKMYMLGTVIVILLLLAASILYHGLLKSSIIVGLTDMLQTSFGWLLPVFMIILAAAALRGTYHRLQYIMTHRDIA